MPAAVSFFPQMYLHLSHIRRLLRLMVVCVYP